VTVVSAEFGGGRHALKVIRSRNLSIIERCVLLAISALTEEALASTDGYTSLSVDEVAAVVMWAPGDVAQTFSSLIMAGLLVEHSDGGVRLPESAFNA
jgi:hypothetical protein